MRYNFCQYPSAAAVRPVGVSTGNAAYALRSWGRMPGGQPSEGNMKTRLLTAAIAILAAVALQAAGTYSTSFPASENPISEGGRWINGKANGGIGRM